MEMESIYSVDPFIPYIAEVQCISHILEDDMIRSVVFVLSAFIGLLSVSLDALAVLNSAELNAQVVKLRADKPDATSGCIENGTELSNCFTSMGSLATWIANVRKPTSSNPLQVDIGPGTFGALTLSCNNTFGYTTFQGSGRKNTIIGAYGTTAGVTAIAGRSISMNGCTSMVFKDMSIGPMASTAGGGILWTGLGTSE